jgi:hypothetical protein
MIRFTVRPLRCYLLGRRVHHGLIGLALIVHDRKDRGRWLSDFLKHPGLR